MLEKRTSRGSYLAPIIAATAFVVAGYSAPAFAQGEASQFAPDDSVFRQLTDLQRQISVLEREVVLEDLKLRRRELDLQMQELEQRNADRGLERERIQREQREARERQREEEEKALLAEERAKAIQEAEEDLRISELRARREALLRSLELQSRREEQALEAEEAAAAAELEAASAAEEAAGDLTVDATQVRQRQRVERTVPREGSLIVAPGAPRDAPPSVIDPATATVGATFDADLEELASLVGVATPTPQPEPQASPEPAPVEITPEPEPEPIAPVVKRLRGTGGILRANLIIAEGGEVNVSEGDSIPGGWTITSVMPDRVMARHEDGDDDVRLIFATQVALPFEPVVEAPAVVAAEPSLGGAFNPLGSASAAPSPPGNFPVPGGFSGF